MKNCKQNCKIKFLFWKTDSQSLLHHDLPLLIFPKLMTDFLMIMDRLVRMLLSFLVVQKIWGIFWPDLQKITMISFTSLCFIPSNSCLLLLFCFVFNQNMKIVGFIVEEYFQTWDKILTGLQIWVLSHNYQIAWNSRIKGKKSSPFFWNFWRGTFNSISLVPVLLKMWFFRLIFYPFDNLQIAFQKERGWIPLPLFALCLLHIK